MCQLKSCYFFKLTYKNLWLIHACCPFAAVLLLLYFWFRKRTTTPFLISPTKLFSNHRNNHQWPQFQRSRTIYDFILGHKRKNWKKWHFNLIRNLIKVRESRETLWFILWGLCELIAVDYLNLTVVVSLETDTFILLSWPLVSLSFQVIPLLLLLLERFFIIGSELKAFF